MTTTKQRQAIIAKLTRSIDLQQRTQRNLDRMGIETLGSRELSDKLVAMFQARIDMHRTLIARSGEANDDELQHETRQDRDQSSRSGLAFTHG